MKFDFLLSLSKLPPLCSTPESDPSRLPKPLAVLISVFLNGVLIARGGFMIFDSARNDWKTLDDYGKKKKKGGIKFQHELYRLSFVDCRRISPCNWAVNRRPRHCPYRRWGLLGMKSQICWIASSNSSGYLRFFTPLELNLSRGRRNESKCGEKNQYCERVVCVFCVCIHAEASNFPWIFTRQIIPWQIVGCHSSFDTLSHRASGISIFSLSL